MFDCKKLAATPLTEPARGSDEFFVTLLLHNTQGKTRAEIAEILGVQDDQARRWIAKGQLILNRSISEGAKAVIRKIGYGEIPKPFINTGPRPVAFVPPVLAKKTSPMVPDRSGENLHPMRGPGLLSPRVQAEASATIH
jgi:hypothetical protein